MAIRTFLSAAGDTFTVADNSVSVFGATGNQTVRIQSGVTGTTIQSNIERVDLAGNMNTYKFVTVAGTGLQIQNTAGVVVGTIGSLDQASSLVFADGSAALVQTGGTAFTVAGAPVTVGATTAAATVTPTTALNTAIVSGVTTTTTTATPSFTVTGATSVTEGNSATFTVSLGVAQTAATTVAYTLAGTGGAVLGTDTGVNVPAGNTGTLTFAAGELTKTVVVPVSFDSAVETGEGVSLTLSAPSTGTSLGTASSKTIAIADPAAPTFALTSTAVAGAATTEGTKITYTITPSSVTDKAYTFTLNTVGDTLSGVAAAAAAADFSPAASTVTFLAGATAAQTVEQTIVSDGVTEGLEGYKTSLLDSAFAVAASTTGTLADPASTAGMTFTLTTGIDTVTSAYGTVSAIIDQTTNPGSGTWGLSDTVSTAAGGTVNLSILSKNDTTAAATVNVAGYSTTNVTTLNIKAIDAATIASNSAFNVSGMTGLTTLNVANSTVSSTTADTLTLSGLASTTALGINTNGQYQDVTVTGADWTGAADALTVTVTGRSGNVNLGTGVETLNIVGATGGRVESLDSTGTATITKVVVTGSDFRNGTAMDTTIATFDASAATGTIDVVLTPGTTLTSAKGGTGTADVLTMDALSTNNVLAGFETLNISAGGAAAVLTNAVGVTTLGVTATSGGAVVFTKAAATQNTLKIASGVDATVSYTSSGASYTLATATGLADTLKVNLGNSGAATTGTLTVTDLITGTAIENLTLTVADYKAATLAAGITLTASSTAPMNVTAAATATNLNLGTITLTNSGTATAGNVVDLSLVTGTTKETMSGVGTLTFSGGTGVDTVTQGTVDDSFTHTFNLGAGNDAFTLTAGTGSGTTALLISTTVVNGDAGDDTFTSGATIGTANDSVTINGGAGTADKLVTSGGAQTLTATISGIELINIQNTAAVETLVLTVAAGYADTVLVTDVTSTAQTNVIGITSTGNVDISKWTSLGWTSGTDQMTVTGSGTIKGWANTQTLNGGTSADTITGGAGADTIIGAGSDDGITGGEGADIIIGGAGNDAITLTETTDVADTVVFATTASNGIDTVTGFMAGTGADLAQLVEAATTNTAQVVAGIADFGVSTNTTLTAGAFALTGGNTATDDIIEITATLSANGNLGLAGVLDGTELLKALSSTTTASTGLTADNSDDDFYVVAYQNSNAYLYQVTNGADTNVTAAELALVSVFNGVAANGFASGDFTAAAVAGVDLTINGGAGDDTIDQGGSTLNLAVNGLGGNDTITTGTGNDIIDGGTGNDTITAGNGNDIITGGTGDDTITGGVGDDTITAGAGIDVISGSAGADTFIFQVTTNADRDPISDFAQVDDILAFDISSMGLNAADYVAGAAVTLINKAGLDALIGGAAANHVIYDTAANIVLMDGTGNEATDNLVAIATNGNIYYSNASGSFTGAVIIGTITAGEAGALVNGNVSIVA